MFGSSTDSSGASRYAFLFDCTSISRPYSCMVYGCKPATAPTGPGRISAASAASVLVEMEAPHFSSTFQTLLQVVLSGGLYGAGRIIPWSRIFTVFCFV